MEGAVAAIWYDRHRRAGGTAHAPPPTGGTRLYHALTRLRAALAGMWPSAYPQAKFVRNDAEATSFLKCSRRPPFTTAPVAIAKGQ